MIYHVGTNEFSPVGSPSNTDTFRRHHTCNLIESPNHPGKHAVLIAGGSGKPDSAKKVELLDYENGSTQWEESKITH